MSNQPAVAVGHLLSRAVVCLFHLYTYVYIGERAHVLFYIPIQQVHVLFYIRAHVFFYIPIQQALVFIYIPIYIGEQPHVRVGHLLPCGVCRAPVCHRQRYRLRVRHSFYSLHRRRRARRSEAVLGYTHTHKNTHTRTLILTRTHTHTHIGWSLGVAESIAGVIVVGFSVDYTLHLGHIYKEAEHLTVHILKSQHNPKL